MRRTPGWILVLAAIGALTVVVTVAVGVFAIISGRGSYVTGAVMGLAGEYDDAAPTSTPSPAAGSPQAKSSSPDFYSQPAEVPAQPGTIIRSEPLEYAVVGGQGYRIAYTSLDAAGTPIAVSGMVFLPTTPAPAEGRRILAWAHGTVGLAARCAPSAATAYSSTGWLERALAEGWVVTASDYAGLGMPGAPTYLVGQQEARDVVNSVRAARLFPDSSTGTDWLVYGASQGGHAALWTADQAAALAPELTLRGVAAAVPAAELPTIMAAQWNTAMGWLIGSYAIVSWQPAYPSRDFQSALSRSGRNQFTSLSSQCIAAGAASAIVLNRINGPFFTASPLSNPDWSATVTEQMPQQPPAGMPMYLAQGMDDTVVLASSNIKLNADWCAAGVTIDSLWLPGVNHQDTSVVAGPAVMEWAAARFAGEAPPNTCGTPPPTPTSTPAS